MSTTVCICAACGCEVSTADLARDASKASGHRNICRPCDSKRRASRAGPPRDHKACDTCGADYEPMRRDQRYCSRSCKDRRPRTADGRWVVCARCNKTFQKLDRDIARYLKHYCCKRCAVAAHSVAIVGPIPAGPRSMVSAAPTARTFLAKVCCRCGATIIFQGSRVPRDCGSCPPRPWVAGPCAECRALFVTQIANARYCSSICERRCQRRRGKQVRSKRIRSTAKRDPISLPTIAERDGWRCHICKRKVRRSTWSLDHLVPLASGGTHTYDNVALAHHRCNTLRGSAGAAQLRLTG